MGSNTSRVIADLREDPLCASILEGNKDGVVALLENRQSVLVKDGDGVTPLLLAALLGHTNIVDILLDSQTLVRYKNKKTKKILFPLLCSAHFGQKDAVDALLRFGVPQKYAECAFFVSTFAGHPRVMKCLLEHGHFIDVTDRHRQTLLHVSASGGHDRIVKVLLDADIKVDMTDKYGSTPLHYGAKHGHISVIDTLLESEADFNIADQKGATALHVAAHNRHHDVVKTLLESGASVDLEDKKGRTPLYIAQRNEDTEMVQMLRHAKKFQEPKKRPWHAVMREIVVSIVTRCQGRGSTISRILLAIKEGRFHDLADELEFLGERCREISGRGIATQRSADDLNELAMTIARRTIRPRVHPTPSRLTSTIDATTGWSSSATSSTESRRQRDSGGHQVPTTSAAFPDTPTVRRRKPVGPKKRPRRRRTSSKSWTTTTTSGSEDVDVGGHTAKLLESAWPRSSDGPNRNTHCRMSQRSQASRCAAGNRNGPVHIKQLTVVNNPVYQNCNNPDRSTIINTRKAGNVVGRGNMTFDPPQTTETDGSDDESDESLTQSEKTS